MASGHSHEDNNHADHHDDDHDHSHDHHHNDHVFPGPTHPKVLTEKDRRQRVLKKLKTASALCFTFLVVEVVGGILSGSLAVLSDAAHLAADLSAFLVAVVGSHIASLPASEAHTFGLKRTESLAALFSMVSLVILSIGLAVEAVRRLMVIIAIPGEAQAVDGKLMATIAFIGVIVNVILAFVLGEDHVHMPGADEDHDHSHDHENDDSSHSHDHGHDDAHSHDEESSLISSPNKSYETEVEHINEVLSVKHHKPERNVNLQAAYLHVLADLAQSVIVFLAGLIIWWKPTWQIADPICTLIFSMLVCYSTLGPIRSSLSVLLEEVPPGVHWDDIYGAICGVPGVSNVHHLHIWSISHGNFILSVHATAENVEQAYIDIKRICNKRNISHLTLQIQPSTIPDECVTCPDRSDFTCR